MSMLGALFGALMKKESTLDAVATEGLIRRMFGPAADEIGLILQDRVRTYRQRNLANIIPRSLEMLREARIEPQAVPLRTLIPLIDKASLEEDDNLTQKWAGLLASAASPAAVAVTHPSFPQILSELSPRDAIVLDRLYALDTAPKWKEFRSRQAVELDVEEGVLDITFWSLERAGLCANTTSAFKLTAFGKAFMEAVRGPRGI